MHRHTHTVSVQSVVWAKELSHKQQLAHGVTQTPAADRRINELHAIPFSLLCACRFGSAITSLVPVHGSQPITLSMLMLISAAQE